MDTNLCHLHLVFSLNVLCCPSAWSRVHTLHKLVCWVGDGRILIFGWTVPLTCLLSVLTASLYLLWNNDEKVEQNRFQITTRHQKYLQYYKVLQSYFHTFICINFPCFTHRGGHVEEVKSLLWQLCGSVSQLHHAIMDPVLWSTHSSCIMCLRYCRLMLPDILINLLDAVVVTYTLWHCVHWVCAHHGMSCLPIVLLHSERKHVYSLTYHLISRHNPMIICQPYVSCPTLVPLAWWALSRNLISFFSLAMQIKECKYEWGLSPLQSINQQLIFQTMGSHTLSTRLALQYLGHMIW